MPSNYLNWHRILWCRKTPTYVTGMNPMLFLCWPPRGISRQSWFGPVGARQIIEGLSISCHTTVSALAEASGRLNCWFHPRWRQGWARDVLILRHDSVPERPLHQPGKSFSINSFIIYLHSPRQMHYRHFEGSTMLQSRQIALRKQSHYIPFCHQKTCFHLPKVYFHQYIHIIYNLEVWIPILIHTSVILHQLDQLISVHQKQKISRKQLFELVGWAGCSTSASSGSSSGAGEG